MMQSTMTPCFLEALQSFVGQQVAIQTNNQVQQGVLTAALNDFVILEICNVPFYFQLSKITWVSPVFLSQR